MQQLTAFKENARPGKLITFEGIDGAGKSTHVQWVVAWLRERGIEVVEVREPGGTPLGEALRALLLKEPMRPITETLLMFAARHELCEQKIFPALMQGSWVVSDRFVDASFAYQGGGRGVELETLEWLAQKTIGDLKADRTFLFDAPLSIAAERRLAQFKSERQDDDGHNKGDRFERENELFFAHVREAYLRRHRIDPKRMHLINTNATIPDIRAVLATHLDALMEKI